MRRCSEDDHRVSIFGGGGVNIITWRPGRVGKGWLFPDGSVRAWAVNSREQPHHADVEHPGGALRFRVLPDGAVELYGEQSRLHEVTSALTARVD